MSNLEIMFILLSSLRGVAEGILIASGIIGLFALISFIVTLGDPNYQKESIIFKSIIKFVSGFIILSTLILAMPTVDNMFKVRLSLIKFQLASPENLNKGADEIERIAKKLECKYLGCEEKK